MPDIFWWCDLSSRQQFRKWRGSRIRVSGERLKCWTLTRKLTRISAVIHDHCVTGDPSLLRTRARLKNLLSLSSNDNYLGQLH